MAKESLPVWTNEDITELEHWKLKFLIIELQHIL